MVNEAVEGGRPSIEYFVIDAKSPLAEPSMRFQGGTFLAEVWLRRGRISADELARAMSQGVEQFRRNLEELQRSPEWGKFKDDQVARLSAQLTVTGGELTRLLNEQLPKLQKELDDLYAQYQKELRRRSRSGRRRGEEPKGRYLHRSSDAAHRDGCGEPAGALRPRGAGGDATDDSPPSAKSPGWGIPLTALPREIAAIDTTASATFLSAPITRRSSAWSFPHTSCSLVTVSRRIAAIRLLGDPPATSPSPFVTTPVS